MQVRAEKTKSSILNAAENEFSELGYYGARIDRIADNANVNKSLIYKYFGNKDKLYSTVFDIVYNRFTEQEKLLLVHDNLDYKAKIRKFVEMEFAFCNENPSYVRMIMWENLDRGKPVAETMTAKSKKPILDSLSRIIRQVNEKREKSLSINEEDLLLTLYSCCFFYFTNMNTMSRIIGKNLSDPKIISRRVDVVSDYLITYLEESK